MKYSITRISKGQPDVIVAQADLRGDADVISVFLSKRDEANCLQTYHRVNYSKSPDCPHYQDNQGYCHSCGILMCEHTAREAGYHTFEL